MQITPLRYEYKTNINYQHDNSKKAYLDNYYNTTFCHKYKIQCNNLKKTFIPLIASLTLMISAPSCQKEPYGPHSTGYQPSEVQSNNSNYPDAPQEVMDEFIAWYEQNCPIWNWPDYEGPFPDNWSELSEQFQQDIVNWWHEHGYPDWNGNG